MICIYHRDREWTAISTRTTFVARGALEDVLRKIVTADDAEPPIKTKKMRFRARLRLALCMLMGA